MTTLATLRARCADAEARAFAAERSLKKSRAGHRKTRVVLGHVLTELETARAGGAELKAVLHALATHHLGDGASRRERDALVDRWIGHARKRPSSDPLDGFGPILGAIDNLLGKLFGEDDHG